MKRLTLAIFLSAVLSPALPAVAAEHTVMATPGASFSPRNLTIAVGDTVTWTNGGGLHNVEADDGSFRCANGCDGEGGSGEPSTAAWSFSLTFDDPGLIAYFCAIHGAPGGIGMSGTITVEGDGGGGDPDPGPVATSFKSGFEVADFADWADRACPTCNSLVAGIRAGESVLPDPEGYATERSGEHFGHLEGSVDANFDLFLQRWTGDAWITVASGTSPNAEERVSFQGGPGRYRWEVRSVSGPGRFFLAFSNPNLGALADNELIQSEEAARKGDFGLESVYLKSSKAKDYLVYDLPVDASEFEAEFRIQPVEGLRIKGKKHQIFQILDGKKIILRLFVVAPEAGEDDPRVFAQVRQGNNKFSERGFGTLQTGKFRKLKIVWKAASEPGASDGVARLFRDKKVVWEIEDLDNDSHRVDQIRFGQITKGKKKTAGRIYFDEFKAEWEGEGEASDGSGAPVAAVTASPMSIPEGDGHQTVVTLDASGSSDPDGGPVTFEWTVPNGRFVNGTGNTDEVVEVTFPGSAPYRVTVVVTDDEGDSRSAEVTVGVDGDDGTPDDGYGA